MPAVIPSPSDMPETEPRILRYVLGQLTSPELDEVEDRLLADEAFFEQVEAVEAEVCDEYVAGRLSAAEQSAFAARLSDNPRLQRRVAFARALAASARPAARMATWWWAAAAALIVATASVIWLARDRTAPPPVTASGPSPVAAPSQPPSTPAPFDNSSGRPELRRGAPAGGPPVVTPAPTVLATITLFGPVVRDAAQMPVLSIPAGPGTVRVEVALLVGDVFPEYRTDITGRSGTSVFESGKLSPTTSASGQSVVTDVPADRLPNGTYEITIYGVRSRNESATRLGTYSFRVTR
jgi:anti-sigma factor RsiW